MMRVTEISRTPAAVRFRLEGRLTEATVADLDEALARALPSNASLLLDLRGLTFADAAGVARLNRLRRARAVLSGASGYLSELLRDDGPAAEGDAAEAMPAEAGLLARLRAGERDACDELVRRESGRMLATAQRLLRNPDEAADAVQDAFLSAFRNLDSFHGEARLSTWLHRIVVNAALMRMRRRKHRPEDSIDELLPRFAEDGHFAEEPKAWTLAGDQVLESQQTRAAVRRCIDRLPETYRSVLVLRDLEDLDTAEAAEMLGISENATKVRLHRARQALRTLLEQELGLGRP